MENLEGKLIFIYGPKGTGKTVWAKTIIKNYPNHRVIYDVDNLSVGIDKTILLVDCYFDLLRKDLVGKYLEKIRGDFLKGGQSQNICIIVGREYLIQDVDSVYVSNHSETMARVLEVYPSEIIHEFYGMDV